MMSKRLSLAAAVAAASLLAASTAVAQSSQNSKPSPYQGVSNPPPDSTILTNDAPPEPAPTAKPAPAPAEPAPAAAKTLSPTDAFVADEESSGATLSRRPATQESSQIVNGKGDDGIVSYLPGPANALPAGTVFHATILQTIVAGETIPGTPFRARLSQDLTYEGRIVVPAGSELRGKVLYAATGRRITGNSVVHLRPDEFVLPNGKRYPLHAEVIDTQGSNTKVSDEGDIIPKAFDKRSAVELAATSGGGALVGAAIAGPVGAAVGSTVGAGVSGARWFLDTQAVDIPAQSTVIFSLTEPMFLNPASTPVSSAASSQN